MTAIKKRYGKLGGYLDKLIYEHPKRNIKKEEVNNSDYYIQVDKNFFIFNEDITDSSYLYIGIAFYSFILITTLIRALFDKNQNYIYLTILFILGTFSFIYQYNRPQKKLILNRQNGLITIPNYLYFKPYTIPFHDALAAWSVKNSGVNPTGPSLSLFHPNGFTSTDVMGCDVIEDWSFIVWYMDKNRPLPPSPAFDEFRNTDFQRRKAEGFPKPLYPSNIPTPEATPEQQAERKSIGGW